MQHISYLTLLGLIAMAGLSLLFTPAGVRAANRSRWRLFA